MMRAIDADALIIEHCKGCSVDMRETCKTNPKCPAVWRIDLAPTVDAVEVVRCKDCGDWQEHEDVHICGHFSSVDLPGLCENIRFVTRPDDYCSSGFRIKRSEPETEEIK